MSDSQSSASASGAAAPSPSNGKDKPDKPDNGFVSGDDTWTQFKNIYSILTGKMSPDGIEQFRLTRDIRNEEADCKRCDEQKEFLLQYSMSASNPHDNCALLGASTNNAHQQALSSVT
jgi:inner membrane protease ATP23